MAPLTRLRSLLRALALFGLAVPALQASAANLAKPAGPEAAYTRAIAGRADKTVATLGIADATKAERVRDCLVKQYRSLRAIHDARDTQVQVLQNQADLAPADRTNRVKAVQAAARVKLDKLHAEFLGKLAAELSPAQVAQVKDGFTYGVLPVTYNAYLKMLPDLSETQKRQIMAWLVEAREAAMDEGTSGEKHKVFGRYKGKINNYLAAAGYNLKEAERNLKK